MLGRMPTGNSGKVSGRCRDSSSVRGTLHGRSRDDWYSCMANVFFRSISWQTMGPGVMDQNHKRHSSYNWTDTDTFPIWSRVVSLKMCQYWWSVCFCFRHVPNADTFLQTGQSVGSKIRREQTHTFFFQASTWCLCPHLLYFSPSSGSHQRSWLSLSDLVAPSATLSALQTARSPGSIGERYFDASKLLVGKIYAAECPSWSVRSQWSHADNVW